MLPYLTIPFSFEPSEFDWLTKFIEPTMIEFQNQNNVPPVGLLNFTSSQLQDIKSAPIWSSIMAFSEKHKLDTPFPQVFIYKGLAQDGEHGFKSGTGNPHIDSYHTPGGKVITVPIRFNILMTGTDTTEMVWWDKNEADSDVRTTEIIQPNGKASTRIQAKGNTILDSWKLLGEPQVRAIHLGKVQEYASFVRTNILHALNWHTGNQRIVFSLRYPNPWDHVFNVIAKKI